MDDGLSYPSLRCVLEHMEGNSRIRLASRCPVIRDIEKAIPLHPDFLSFDDNAIRLNNICYRLCVNYDKINASDERYERDKSEECRLTPGDIQTGSLSNKPWESKYLEILFEIDSDEIHSRRLPSDWKIHEAEKKMTCFLLGDRAKIRAKTLAFEFYGESVIRLPEGFKVITSALDIQCGNFESILEIVDPMSYPLQDIFTSIERSRMLENTVLKSAKKLFISNEYIDEEFMDEIYEGLWKLENKTVTVQLDMEEDNIIDLFDNWVKSPRDIGSTFTFCVRKEMTMKALDTVKKRFNGKYVKLNRPLDKPDEKLDPNYKCISFPTSSNSELLAYVLISKYGSQDIKLEMMPRGSATSLEWSMSMSGVLNSLGAALNLYNLII
ncbi:hypothetical protein GCK72_007255 [Caenorhabditis remanei]|uniref:F-box associated domain-containing protein n=1 Tax=Caenorhabditis remanei TaxID=31234 RepID=A0A6A5HKT8_CAERE|nr:hypothetical protein GCK72_007255 [Caenorhabditis remanei]KAF1767296.1 hypothetical protein GCK72_007255 [Caenorhabditis remanei]